MKKYLLIAVLFSFASCDESKDTKSTNEANLIEEATSEEFCYYRTEGANNEDSNIIKLIIEGKNVSGEMKYLPYEKDASVGTVLGTRDGNIIKLTWTYFQEGMEAKEPVYLKIDTEGIWQQQSSYNDNGEIIIKDDAPYENKFLQMDCTKFPERIY